MPGPDAADLLQILTCSLESAFKCNQEAALMNRMGVMEVQSKRSALKEESRVPQLTESTGQDLGERTLQN